MSLNFTWINLLILFGASQALMFTVILLFQRKHPGVTFFATFIFIFAYNGFETFNWSAGLNYIFFDMFGFIIIYAVGPSFYLYISRLLYPEISFSRKQILAHFAPVIFQFVARIGILVYHFLWINKIIVSDVPSMQLMNIVWLYAEPMSVILFLIYYGATVLKLRKYKKAHVAKLHLKDRQAVVQWVHALMVAIGILAIAWPITVLAPGLFNVPFGDHYYPIELALVLFNYWVVFYGYYKVKTISVRSAPSDNSGDQEIERHLSRLFRAMEEEKLYLDTELSVNKLASVTGISAKTISVVLNQHRQTNFNDFINGYRIKEVQLRLADPGNRHLTISGIAIDCGFNSQATFQRVFKNNTGMAPREYMTRQLQNIDDIEIKSPLKS